MRSLLFTCPFLLSCILAYSKPETIAGAKIEFTNSANHSSRTVAIARNALELGVGYFDLSSGGYGPASIPFGVGKLTLHNPIDINSRQVLELTWISDTSGTYIQTQLLGEKVTESSAGIFRVTAPPFSGPTFRTPAAHEGDGNPRSLSIRSGSEATLIALVEARATPSFFWINATGEKVGGDLTFTKIGSRKISSPTGGFDVSVWEVRLRFERVTPSTAGCYRLYVHTDVHDAISQPTYLTVLD